MATKNVQSEQGFVEFVAYPTTVVDEDDDGTESWSVDTTIEPKGGIPDAVKLNIGWDVKTSTGWKTVIDPANSDGILAGNLPVTKTLHSSDVLDAKSDAEDVEQNVDVRIVVETSRGQTYTYENWVMVQELSGGIVADLAAMDRNYVDDNEDGAITVTFDGSASEIINGEDEINVCQWWIWDPTTESWENVKTFNEFTDDNYNGGIENYDFTFYKDDKWGHRPFIYLSLGSTNPLDMRAIHLDYQLESKVQARLDGNRLEWIDRDGDGSVDVSLDGSNSEVIGGGGYIDSYTWYVDGSQSGTGSELNETLSAGEYEVTLVVEDNYGITDETSKTLRVVAPGGVASVSTSDITVVDEDKSGAERYELTADLTVESDLISGYRYWFTWEWKDDSGDWLQIDDIDEPIKNPEPGIRTFTYTPSEAGVEPDVDWAQVGQHEIRAHVWDHLETYDGLSQNEVSDVATVTIEKQGTLEADLSNTDKVHVDPDQDDEIPVVFDASNSDIVDGDGTIDHYEWYLLPEGADQDDKDNWDKVTETPDPTYTYTFTEDNPWPDQNVPLRLIVVDEYGREREDWFNLAMYFASDGSPIARLGGTIIEEPFADDDGDGIVNVSADGGRSQAFEGASITGYEWFVDGQSVATGENVTLALDTDSEKHDVKLEVTDSQGRTGSVTETVTVKTDDIVESADVINEMVVDKDDSGSEMFEVSATVELVDDVADEVEVDYTWFAENKKDEWVEFDAAVNQTISVNQPVEDGSKNITVSGAPPTDDSGEPFHFVSDVGLHPVKVEIGFGTGHQAVGTGYVDVKPKSGETPNVCTGATVDGPVEKGRVEPGDLIVSWGPYVKEDKDKNIANVEASYVSSALDTEWTNKDNGDKPDTVHMQAYVAKESGEATILPAKERQHGGAEIIHTGSEGAQVGHVDYCGDVTCKDLKPGDIVLVWDEDPHGADPRWEKRFSAGHKELYSKQEGRHYPNRTVYEITSPGEVKRPFGCNTSVFQLNCTERGRFDSLEVLDSSYEDEDGDGFAEDEVEMEAQAYWSGEKPDDLTFDYSWYFYNASMEQFVEYVSEQNENINDYDDDVDIWARISGRNGITRVTDERPDNTRRIKLELKTSAGQQLSAIGELEILASHGEPVANPADTRKSWFDYDDDGKITVTFDGSASSMRNGTGEIVEYEWFVAGSSVGTGKTLKHEFTSDDVASCELKVTDDQGNTDTATFTLDLTYSSSDCLYYEIEQNGKVQEVIPVSYDMTAEDFYNYGDYLGRYPDGGTGPRSYLPESAEQYKNPEESRILLYRGTRGVNLVVNHDEGTTTIDGASKDEGSGGKAEFQISGLPSAVQRVLSDDHPEDDLTDPRWVWDATWEDGGVWRGGLNEPFEVTVKPEKFKGIDSWVFWDGSGGDISLIDLDMDKPVTIRMTYREPNADIDESKLVVNDDDYDKNETVELDGSASVITCNSATLDEYRWSVHKDSGWAQVATGETAQYNADQGVTDLKLEVEDSNGQIGTDKAKIKVSAPTCPGPVAQVNKAGLTVVDEDNDGEVVVTFDGSPSHIPDKYPCNDHSITEYRWYVNGSQVGTGQTYDYTLTEKQKDLKLEVEDDKGLVGTDESEIKMLGPDIGMPVADPSNTKMFHKDRDNDYSITVQLDGSASYVKNGDGSITDWKWDVPALEGVSAKQKSGETVEVEFPDVNGGQHKLDCTLTVDSDEPNTETDSQVFTLTLDFGQKHGDPVAKLGSTDGHGLYQETDRDNDDMEAVKLDGSPSKVENGVGHLVDHRWFVDDERVDPKSDGDTPVMTLQDVSLGEHQGHLEVEDDRGQTDKRNFIIKVKDYKQQDIHAVAHDTSKVDDNVDGKAMVRLDGTDSYHDRKDGDITEYIWKVDGQTIATGPQPEHEFSLGETEVTLLIKDQWDYKDTDQCTVTVGEGNRAPTPVINVAYSDDTGIKQDVKNKATVEVDQHTYGAAETLILDADGSSDDSTPEEELEYRWYVDSLLIGEEKTVSKQVEPGRRNVRLVVVDAEGKQGSKTYTLALQAPKKPSEPEVSISQELVGGKFDSFTKVPADIPAEVERETGSAEVDIGDLVITYTPNTSVRGVDSELVQERSDSGQLIRVFVVKSEGRASISGVGTGDFIHSGSDIVDSVQDTKVYSASGDKISQKVPSGSIILQWGDSQRTQRPKPALYLMDLDVTEQDETAIWQTTDSCQPVLGSDDAEMDVINVQLGEVGKQGGLVGENEGYENYLHWGYKPPQPVVHLDWKAMSNVDFYRVERANNWSGWTTIDEIKRTTYTDRSILPRQLYHGYQYRIVAITKPEYAEDEYYRAPSNVVKVQNQEVRDIPDTFIIERRRPNGLFEPLQKVSGEANSYTDTQIANGIDYEYRIKTTIGDMETDYSNVVQLSVDRQTGQQQI